MSKIHQYSLTVTWTGNKGNGTSSYTSYSRNHKIKSGNKPLILASSDPTFLGDPNQYNPEELFIASISSCHMLWYLHLCSTKGINVVSYSDTPNGIMKESKENGGFFKKVTLNPSIVITEESMIDAANNLHEEAHRFCFIANSCNFQILVNPKCKLI